MSIYSYFSHFYYLAKTKGVIHLEGFNIESMGSSPGGLFSDFVESVLRQFTLNFDSELGTSWKISQNTLIATIS